MINQRCSRLPSRGVMNIIVMLLCLFCCAGIKGRFVKAEELDAYRAGLLPGQNGIPQSL